MTLIEISAINIILTHALITHH